MKNSFTPFFLGSVFLVLVIAPLLRSSEEGISQPVRVDLQGATLSSAPNPTLLREGKVPAILNVTLPNIQIHRTSSHPSKGTVLLLPGGGYQVLAIEHEGIAIADLLNKGGYDVAILEYSIGKKTSREEALADAIKAVQLLKKKGAVLGINTASFDVMGFSAGGHLAARLLHEAGSGTTFDKILLIYPAYLDAPNGIAPEVAPPAGIHTKVFVLIGNKDQPKWISGAAAYVAASKANGEQAEYHLEPDAGHGGGIHLLEKGAPSEYLQAFLQKE